MVSQAHRFREINIVDLVFTSRSNRAIFRTEPTCPVACFERFEFVAFWTGVQKNELRNRRAELAELFGQDGAQQGTCEGGPGLLATCQQINGLKMLARFGAHGTYDRQFIGDPRTVGHQCTEVHSRKRSWNTLEGPTGCGTRFGVPCFELGRGSA